MASREIGKMLDELMGNHRNLNPDDKVTNPQGLNKQIHFALQTNPGSTSS